MTRAKRQARASRKPSRSESRRGNEAERATWNAYGSRNGEKQPQGPPVMRAFAQNQASTWTAFKPTQRYNEYRNKHSTKCRPSKEYRRMATLHVREICKLPGCSRDCFKRINGKCQDFCSFDHMKIDAWDRQNWNAPLPTIVYSGAAKPSRHSELQKSQARLAVAENKLKALKKVQQPLTSSAESESGLRSREMSDSDSSSDGQQRDNSFRPWRKIQWRDYFRKVNQTQRTRNTAQRFLYDPATQALADLSLPRQSESCKISEFSPLDSKERAKILAKEGERAKEWRNSNQKHPQRYQINLQTPSAVNIMGCPKNHLITVHLDTNVSDLIEHAHKYLGRPDLELRAAMHGYPLHGHETLLSREIFSGDNVQILFRLKEDATEIKNQPRPTIVTKERRAVAPNTTCGVKRITGGSPSDSDEDSTLAVSSSEAEMENESTNLHFKNPHSLTCAPASWEDEQKATKHLAERLRDKRQKKNYQNSSLNRKRKYSSSLQETLEITQSERESFVESFRAWNLKHAYVPMKHTNPNWPMAQWEGRPPPHEYQESNLMRRTREVTNMFRFNVRLDNPKFECTDPMPTLTDDYIENHPVMNNPHLYNSYAQLKIIGDPIPYDPEFEGFLPEAENFEDAIVYVTAKRAGTFIHGRFAFGKKKISLFHLMLAIQTQMPIDASSPNLFFGRTRIKSSTQLQSVLEYRPTYLWVQNELEVVPDKERVLYIKDRPPCVFQDPSPKTTDQHVSVMKRFFFTKIQTEQVRQAAHLASGLTHVNWFAEKMIPEKMAVSRNIPSSNEDAEIHVSLSPESKFLRRFIVTAPADLLGTMKTFIVKVSKDAIVDNLL